MTTLDAETVARLVELIEPSWTVLDSEPTPAGFLPVRQLRAATDTDTRRAILKATPPDGSGGVACETRVLALLADTPIPVPTVYGAIDDASGLSIPPELPTPAFLSSYVPGTTLEQTEQATLSTDRLATLARACGRQAAHLHALAPFDIYGFLGPDGPTLQGERPAGTADTLRVTEPTSDWPTQMERWVNETVADLADSRFADRQSQLRAALTAGVEQLDGPFRPVLGHVDYGPGNVRHDPETGELTGMLDWAFSLSVTPGYDPVMLERSLSGGHWGLLADHPDHRELVRRAAREGYRAVGAETDDDRVDRTLRERDAHGGTYDLLGICRAMVNLDEWLGARGATPGQIDGAARTLGRRADVLL